ncbi:hypothetical protein B1T45_23460 [Mycobacterium kansasii]|uniref:Uncharacterized protein n=1 Tax=Mycobacterium kansasii ATCC 12478 TaxID=557599 RepID=U5X1M0_MYCKA|nr:hypothetical protein MKAN_06140 [Mycobacterium kansasii ATCC 12478]ARG58216.1 hypothetical protein B1T43_22915 [Mycobacterium kansasii]ARG63730.1 hypothetical protein B1T45_23460 [Mycobacterium kansasii]ARG71375.1 hypothetical protein B1T47_22805 [Mycobacterium kansasii]ARG74110.1 hypothetical protein B1T51_05930 [Mycobacterium kansasii]
MVANDRGTRSVRCHFSNRSENKLDLFTGALDDVGPLDAVEPLHHRRVPQDIHCCAVARLDEFVGPKS